jgi:ketosteroid isomerase-like protein
MVRIVLALVLAVAVIPIQGDIPPALAAMADTERAFAKSATVNGWRDAFLEFFADDAISFSPGVGLAKDGLRKEPSTPFSIFQLIWEPRTGDVSASGDLGWLTGPSTSIHRKAAEPKTGYGCYLSIWRKQPNGTWRVFIDVGASAPEPVQFAPGFTRTTIANPYQGRDGKAAAESSLIAADRALNAQIESTGFARAFDGRLAPASRLHRPGSVPQLGRDAIAKWLDANASSGAAKDVAAESAAAGDFGYTHGTFEVKEPKPVSGVYIRLWNRDASGRWWLTVDVAQPFKK